MFSLFRPTAAAISKLHERLRSTSLTYPSSYAPSNDRGAILDRSSVYVPAPPGFLTDHSECELGHGVDVFEAACRALRAWRMFPPQMANLEPASVPIEVGQIVSVMFRAGPLWTANSARILRVFQETNATSRFGFTYGTLPGHIARGEETFLVEHDKASDRVTYSVHAFSRPSHWIAWVGYPYLRFQQARFRRLSGESMKASVRPTSN